MLMFDGMNMLDIAGPSEVFTEANSFGAEYGITYVTVDGRDVRASNGLNMSADGGAFDDRRWDTVFIPGDDRFPKGPEPEALVRATRFLADRAGRLASVCTGAFLLGSAGLLDGRKVTTHWRHASELARRFPMAHVEPDRIFVHDRDLYTSAGVSTGIDLALSLVETDYDAALARKVAQSLVIYLRRSGGQSQFSSLLDDREPSQPALQMLVDSVRSAPSQEYSVDRLSALSHISPRQLTRLFRRDYDTTPMRFVQHIRIGLAKSRLEAGYSVTMAAQLSGFGSPESMRRAFIRYLHVSPREYQRRFGITQPRVPKTS
ncbi:GlxA family transcriptional regulator [Bifidobacterium subtile]|nr:DJ-1/PfpI family protein [Bifidobacterium subtile]MCI1222415.1 DJ-1/PfpI family protein [Bifidobacterium subtile]MCI1241007.1 DJ-1/PfpI family protein [Bifidobacterium subtile]MCI1257897.1 DJ-1/PfpI family protein [Bifidobacterium subtile]